MSEARFGALAAVAAVVASLHGLVYWPLLNSHTFPDSREYIALGHAIDHGNYAVSLHRFEVTAYDKPGQPQVDVTGIAWPPATAALVQRDVFRTPGYPLLLASVGGGDQGTSRYALYIAQAILIGLTTALTIFVARRLWGPRVALLAGALYALDPYSKRYVTLVLTETLATALAVAAIYCAVRAWQARSLQWWVAAGASAGALTLVRPVFTLAIPLLALAALIAHPRRRLVASAVALVAALVIVVPWALRNEHVSGRFVLAGYGDGWNLLIAAHGEGHGRPESAVYADPSYERDFASVRRYAPTAAQLKASKDAYAHYLVRADADQRARAWHVYSERLRANPFQVAWEFVYRAWFLWQPHTGWFQPAGVRLLVLSAVDWVLLLLAAAGAAIALRRGGPARSVALFVVVYTLVSAVGHVEARYTMPLRPLYLAFAVAGALSLIARFRPGVLATSRETQSAT